MSHELVYTSAQQGLKPGSYGFCTVLATEGISKALQDRLESLSGYEPAFALTDRRAHLNPVNFSHLIVTVANQKFHVLSRVADAGADYSGRSNKIAHHVALQPNELTSASAAATLATPNFCKTHFDGNPRWLSVGVKPSSTARPPGKCSAWEAVCDDAGWAGVLVEQTLKTPARPITLIYSPGCDVLPLVVEAMSLLPLELQWRTTFSTFFTKLPVGIECQWRFVLDGTSIAEQARRNLQSPPIDLTNPGKVPIDSPLVEAARTGQTVSVSPLVASSSAASSFGGSTPPSLSSNSRSHKRETSGQANDSYKLEPLPKSMRPGRPMISAPALGLSAKQGPSPVMIIGTITGFVVALVLIAGLGIFWFSKPQVTPIAVASQEKSKEGVASNEIEKPKLFQKKAEPKRETQLAPSIDATVTKDDGSVAETHSENVSSKKESINLEYIFKDITQKGDLLPLPKREQGVNRESAVERELCKIFVKESTDCDLALETTERLNDGQPRLFLKSQTPQDDGTRVWNVIARSRNLTFNEDKDTSIGQFKLKAQSLSFDWDYEAPEHTYPLTLRYCLLRVQVEDDTHYCRLLKPTTIQSIEHLDFEQQRKGSLAAGLPAGALVSAGSLRYDMELRFDGWSDVKRGQMASDVFQKFEVPADSKQADTQVDVEFRFVPPTPQREGQFDYRAFVYLPYKSTPLSSQSQKTSVRSDKFDEPKFKGFKDGFLIKDLEQVELKGNEDKNKAKQELTKATKKVSALKSEAADATDPEQRFALTEQIVKQTDLIKKAEESIKEADEYLRDWASAIRSRIRAIESKLEVRFSIYLEIGDRDGKTQKMILAETDPAPSKSKE